MIYARGEMVQLQLYHFLIYQNHYTERTATAAVSRRIFLIHISKVCNTLLMWIFTNFPVKKLVFYS